MILWLKGGEIRGVRLSHKQWDIVGGAPRESGQPITIALGARVAKGQRPHISQRTCFSTTSDGKDLWEVCNQSTFIDILLLLSSSQPTFLP